MILTYTRKPMQRSEYGITLDADELRNIIKGVTEIRKCPDCETHGESWTLHYVSADDPNELEQFKDVSEVFATNFVVDDYPEYSWGECYLHNCETCAGVGYIFIEEY